MLVLALLVAVVVSTSAKTGDQEAPIRPVDGVSIFRSNCAACHGLDGRGNGPVSKVLKRGVPDLTKLSERNGDAFPAIHVRSAIMFGADDLLSAHGSREMPIWGPIFHEIEFDRDLGNVRLENITIMRPGHIRRRLRRADPPEGPAPSLAALPGLLPSRPAAAVGCAACRHRPPPSS